MKDYIIQYAVNGVVKGTFGRCLTPDGYERLLIDLAEKQDANVTHTVYEAVAVVVGKRDVRKAG